MVGRRSRSGFSSSHGRARWRGAGGDQGLRRSAPGRGRPHHEIVSALEDGQLNRPEGLPHATALRREQALICTKAKRAKAQGVRGIATTRKP